MVGGLLNDSARCPVPKPRHFVSRLGNVGPTSGSVTEGRETASGHVRHYVPGFTEPTLMLRIKYRHGSASARCLTRHFPPAPFAAAFRYTDYADAPAHFDGRKLPRQAWIQAGTPVDLRWLPTVVDSLLALLGK